jgi:hypothetical protein
MNDQQGNQASIDLLKEDGTISLKEFENISGHLTDARFDQSPVNLLEIENDEDYIPLEDLPQSNQSSARPGNKISIDPDIRQQPRLN